MIGNSDLKDLITTNCTESPTVQGPMSVLAREVRDYYSDFQFFHSKNRLKNTLRCQNGSMRANGNPSRSLAESLS